MMNKNVYEMTIIETYGNLLKEVEELSHSLSAFLVPTPGISKTVEDVIDDCDSAQLWIDAIIVKVLAFEEVRTGNTTVSMV